MPKGCIIYCIEKGMLEKDTLLSIHSIRANGGFLNTYDIYCIQPRQEFPISTKIKTKLEKLGVQLICKPVNTKHRYYAILNKSLAFNYVMDHFNYDQYIFLAGDTLILEEPTKFLNPKHDILLSPVYKKSIGIRDLEDKNGSYWRQLFEYFGNDRTEYLKVKTVFDEEEILGYWNAGIMVLNGKNDLVKKWNQLTLHLLDHRIYPEPGVFFVEQSALATTILAGNYSVGALPLSHNFPLSQEILEHKHLGIIDKICVMHHLGNLQMLKKLPLHLISTKNMAWIIDHLKSLKREGQIFTAISDKVKEIEKSLKERFYYFIYKFTNKEQR